jgi:cbb3-type cytochrome oxidase subunit 3
MSEEWVAIYKIGRLALLALALVGVTVWVFRRSRKERLEEPARRMLEEDDS